MNPHFLMAMSCSKYGTTRVLFAKYIHGKTDENHVLFSNCTNRISLYFPMNWELIVHKQGHHTIP